MKIKLTMLEERVIGCLIEKSLTTPDQYPLSLNALTNACNQKSNREPVMSLSEGEVQETLDRLKERHLVMNQAGVTSRVPKYLHRFCNTEFGDLKLTPQELGIVCVLFLRGPQTPGELRTRTNRLCEFSNVSETESVLEAMMGYEDPLVVRLEREPGKRESRYQHCFSDVATEISDLKISENSAQLRDNNSAGSTNEGQSGRIDELEEKIEVMQLEIDELREKIETLIQ